MGVDGRQYYLLDTGPVPSDKFLRHGKPLDSISVHDLLLNDKSANGKEVQRVLAEIEAILRPFQRDGEPIQGTLERIVSEFNAVHQSQCWNCGSKEMSRKEMCPSCGKQLSVLVNPLLEYSSGDSTTCFPEIISTIYVFIIHPGGLKWVSIEDLLQRLRWIQARWIEGYRSMRQCWNCHSLVASEDLDSDVCAFCGRRLGFRLQPITVWEEKFAQILQHFDIDSEEVLSQKLEKEFDLEPPYSNNLQLIPYSKQLANILNRDLTEDEKRKVENLYQYRWWGLNRRD